MGARSQLFPAIPAWDRCDAEQLAAIFDADMAILASQIAAGYGPRHVGISKGRVRIYVGENTEFGDRSGWCWRYRLLVQRALGRKLATDEHVHHVDGVKWHDWLENLCVIRARYHGMIEAYGRIVAKSRRGEFREIVLAREFPMARDRAVISFPAGVASVATGLPVGFGGGAL